MKNNELFRLRNVFGYVLFCLLLTGCGWRVSVVKKIEPVMYDGSPLFKVIEMESFTEFEKKVGQHPEWMNQKSKHLPDSENLSVLTAVAITARTNYVRVLIKNGADVAEALEWSKRNQCPNGMQLIVDVCKEFGKKVSIP